jgi:mRNA interferase MazF
MVKKSFSYIPEQGDIVYFDFSPSVGREQKGVRPGLVMSRAFFNKSSELCLICPITSKQKFYPFETPIQTEKISGVILVDNMKMVDYKARNIKFVSFAPLKVVEEVREKFITLIQ